MSRRPTYFIWNVFLPVIALSLLGQLTFFVPVESGERLSYTLTVLLSLSVYSSSTTSIMPRSSLTTPLIVRLVLFDHAPDFQVSVVWPRP